jgi:hypothetical protein
MSSLDLLPDLRTARPALPELLCLERLDVLDNAGAA